MNVKRLILTVLTVFLVLISLAQDYTIVEIDGKKFYSHKVEAGHTLYAIASLYDSDEEIISEYNKELLTDGLKVGQTILVPVNSDFKPGVIKNPVRIEDGFLIHRVLKKETLYSICQNYTVDINDVIELNPGTDNGVQKGQELRIPPNNVNSAVAVAPPVQFESSSPKWKTHTVLPGETLYGISKKYGVEIKSILDLNNGLPEGLKAGQAIFLPIEKETQEEEKEDSTASMTQVIQSWGERRENPFKDKYNVALALPLYLSDRDTSEITNKEQRIRRVGLSFYRGVSLAAKKLEEEGLSMNLEVMSISNDRNQLRTIASSGNLHDMDMFIGPFQKEALKKIIEISKGSGAPVICPTPQSGSMLLSNQNVFKVVPSGSTLMGQTALHIAAMTNNPNVILVKTEWVNDKRKQQVFENTYYEALGDSISRANRKLKVITPGELSANSLIALLSNSRENIIVMPSEQKISIGHLVNVLPLLKKRKDITVYLTKKWLDSDYIDADIRNDFKVRFPTHFSTIYSSEDMLVFNQDYEDQFDDAIDEYAVLGYDIMLYFGRGLMNYGLDFSYYIDRMSDEGVLDYQFDFQRVGPDSGFENKGVQFVYFDDFVLKLEQ